MKAINKYIVKGLAFLCIGLLGACSNQAIDELDHIVNEVETSRATVIEATIERMTAGGLDAALQSQLGLTNKYNVTKLKLSGDFNAQDVMTLHKLSSLEELDMADVAFVRDANDESNYYEFRTMLWNNLEDVREYFMEDEIGSYMFAGMATLKSVKLPNSVKFIRHGVFMNCTLLETVVFPASVEVLNSSVFYQNNLETLTIPSTIKEVSDNFIYENPRLKAIFWESDAKVPGCSNIYNNNDNVLLYVSNKDVFVSPLWNNVVVNGVAESITIQAKERWSSEDDVYAFVAPRAFTAKKMSYVRYFDGWTNVGYDAAGWETIVLPFVPTSFTHETKGTIAPFNSGVSGAKPFWLRSLTSNGFVDVTSMKANVPYIISMPNSDSYLEEYCLNGWVTFTGENVKVPETVSRPAAVSGPKFSLQPTYEFVNESRNIYSLNVRDGLGYNRGSVFLRGGGDVRAFEAYAVLDGRSVSRVIDLDCSSSNTRSAGLKNNTGIPQIGDK